MMPRRLRLIERHSTPVLLAPLVALIVVYLSSLGIPSLNCRLTRGLIDTCLSSASSSAILAS